MRLLDLAVEHFGPVRRASLAFGPGLNVLYGPNDLGKSHLAEAIRAALLLPHGSTEHKTYVPWGTDETPEVVLTFQAQDGQRWRVRKTFGSGSKGSSTLARAKGSGEFNTEVTGREVDGRLRDLLQWGIPSPGGKKGSVKGLPETYLSTVLLGRQADVLSVFTRTLEQDPDDSGKKRLTLALQALAQPELFRRVLQQTQTRVELAFDSRGHPRRAKGSPFVGVREEVKAAEQRLADLEQQVGSSQGVRQQLEALVTRRDEQALELEEARARRDRVRQAVERALAIRAAQERLEQARQALQQIQAAHDAVARKEAEGEGLRARIQTAEGDVAKAKAEVETAAQALRAAEEHLRTVTAERADAVLLKKQTLETRRVQLETELADATRQAESARAATRLVADATSAERLLAEADAEVERLRALLARTDLELRLATARREYHQARSVVEAVTQAETQLAARKRALADATLELAKANTALERAEAEHQGARDQLQRVQSESGAQQRALKEEELSRRTLEAQAAEQAATAQAQQAREVQASATRVHALGQELEKLQAATARARDAVDVAGKAHAEAEARLARVGLVAAYMQWRTSLAQRDEAQAAVVQVERLRGDATALRARADQSATELAAQALPAPPQLAQLRTLERELQVAEARVSVGLTVTIVPRREFELQAASDGEPPESCTATPGDDELVCEAKRQLHLVLGDLAELTVTGGQERDQELVRSLRTRWAQEAEPLLLAAGVPDLDHLEQRCRAAAQRQTELEALRQQAGHLEAQAATLGDVATRLEQAQRQLDEREATLAGHDRASLEQEATRLGLLGPAGPLFAAPAAGPGTVLDAQRREADARLTQARQALEGRRVELGQASVRVESHAQELERARTAHNTAATALGDPADAVLVRAQAALGSAEAALATIAAERAALANEQNTALGAAQEHLRVCEARRETARRSRDACQTERDKAQAEVASLEGQLTIRRQAAQGLDLPALESRASTVEAELAALTSAGTPPAPPVPSTPTQADLDRLSSTLAATRSQLSRAESNAAARRANRDSALAARDAKLQELGGDPTALLTTAEATQTRARAEHDHVVRELASLDQQRDTAIDAAKAQLAAATTQHEQTLTREQACATARDQARSALDTALGQLELLRRQAEALDRAAAEAQVATCQAELTRLPAPDPTVPHDAASLQAAEAAATDAERLLTQVNQDLTRAQGQLEVIGGNVIQERAQDAKDALERLRAKEQDVELDYAAWKLLKETLEEAEQQETAHLGQALVEPVSKRFRELTANRYGPLSLGPNLEAHGIQALGELREIERLSAGTRDQLSTLLRLTVAAQLQSCLVLDDQLAQSDPKRLKWFTDVLRDSATTTQIVVFTCRPEDYLLPSELAPTLNTVSAADVTSAVRALRLESLVERLALNS